MKKALFIAMIAALTVVSGSCGKNETPAAVTSAAQPTKTYPELNFPDTDWADNSFNEAVNKYSEFTETDIMGMASACAKGVAKSQKCAFDEAWDASYSVVTELTECSKKIRDISRRVLKPFRDCFAAIRTKSATVQAVNSTLNDGIPAKLHADYSTKTRSVIRHQILLYSCL